MALPQGPVLTPFLTLFSRTPYLKNQFWHHFWHFSQRLCLTQKNWLLYLKNQSKHHSWHFSQGLCPTRKNWLLAQGPVLTPFLTFFSRTASHMNLTLWHHFRHFSQSLCLTRKIWLVPQRAILTHFWNFPQGQSKAIFRVRSSWGVSKWCQDWSLSKKTNFSCEKESLRPVSKRCQNWFFTIFDTFLKNCVSHKKLTSFDQF